VEYRGGHSALGTPSAKNALRIPLTKSVFHSQSPYSNRKVISLGNPIRPRGPSVFPRVIAPRHLGSPVQLVVGIQTLWLE
jgi:hypothetical protein